METRCEDRRWKGVAKLLALALSVPICPPDTMLLFILIMVGQFDDSVNSTENTNVERNDGQENNELESIWNDAFAP